MTMYLNVFEEAHLLSQTLELVHPSPIVCPCVFMALCLVQVHQIPEFLRRVILSFVFVKNC